MANEVTNATLVTNGGRLAEQLNAALHQTVYDSTDLRAVIDMIPWMAGSGSATMSVTKLPAPGPAAAASSETSGGFSNSTYTTGEYQLTAARYGRQLTMSDLAGLTAPAGGVDFPRLLQTLVQTEALTYTDLIAALFPSISASAGTTEVDLSVDNIFTAMATLELANVQGDYSCVLHGQQWADFRNSLRSESGAVQYRADTQGVLDIGAYGAKGSWGGINFWVSDSVVTANAGEDRAGCLFGAGAFAYRGAPVAALAPIVSPYELLRGDTWFIEADRSHANGLTTAILNMYPAVAIAENARAVKIVTDA